MGFSRFPLFLLPFLLYSILQTRSTFAIKKSYVVYLGSHSHLHSHGREIMQVDKDLAEQSHYELLAGFVGGTEAAKKSIVYSYTNHINGFAANLEEEKAAEIRKHPNVISVFPNRGHQLHTTRSWEFLGLEKNGEVQHGSLWEKTKFGEDLIMANIDSGVWPESKSFSDEGYGPVPPRWKGGCTDTSPDGVRCNRKLIGAKFFNKGYEAIAAGLGKALFNTTRDEIGHGTKTLSILGGNFIPNATILGFNNGTAKGGTPRARVAAYRACGVPILNGEGCFDADIIAAFDAAIHDGVDVISISLGTPTARDYFNDGQAIGSFHAVKHGIIVVASAGNQGPELVVNNLAPWFFTVAASTIDRDCVAYAKLGNHMQLQGLSFLQSSLPSNGKMYPLVRSDVVKANTALPVAALFCNHTSLDPKQVKGKIVVCLSGGGVELVQKSFTTVSAGAVGIVVVNHIKSAEDKASVTDLLPTLRLSPNETITLFEYMNSTTTPTAYISGAMTMLGITPAPMMGSFSSQGPNSLNPEILKPDITGPGLDIVASYSPKAPNALPSGMPGGGESPFESGSGTSIACPHVAAICGLLKAQYPNWSPYAIKSAIMTTASSRDNLMKPMLNASYIKATPFSYGAGHIQPHLAMDPGLVYDLNITDHLNFLCAIGYNESKMSLFIGRNETYKCPEPAMSLLNMNYPSITIPSLSAFASLTRKLKNVGTFPATYNATIHSPPGISISVDPQILTFSSVGEEKTFNITIKTKGPSSVKDYVFGELNWSDGHHNVKSPIAVKAAAVI